MDITKHMIQHVWHDSMLENKILSKGFVENKLEYISDDVLNLKLYKKGRKTFVLYPMQDGNYMLMFKYRG